MSKKPKYPYCKGCPLDGNPKVFGEGDPASKIVFIGRNPGATERRLGRPFVGKAGERLDKVLEDLGLKREDVWITNLVKCWTKDDDEPPDEAAEHCYHYLFHGELHGQVVLLGKYCQKHFTQLVTSSHPSFNMIHPSAALRTGIAEAKLRRDTKNLKKVLRDTGLL